MEWKFYIDGELHSVQPFNCIVGNFIKLQRSAITLSEEDVVDISGVTRSLASSYTVVDDGGVTVTGNLGWDANADENDGDFGIVVGVGDDATTIDTYALETKIDQGSDSGELIHSDCTIGSITDSAGVLVLPIFRSFSNLYDVNTIVSEVALYVKMPSDDIICIVHDILTTPITLPLYGTLNVVMNFKMNV
jgi:hypothetical protein